MGARLDVILSPTVRVLHDRRIPGTRANIEHLVVCPTGVLVVDAKRYVGPRPALRVDGGIITPHGLGALDEASDRRPAPGPG